MRTSSLLSNALAALFLSAAPATAKCYDHWVQIWGTMPQLVEPANLPNPPFVRSPASSTYLPQD